MNDKVTNGRVAQVLLLTLALVGLELVPAPVFEWLPGGGPTDAISGVAEAQYYGTSRRVARRTARRTSRRHNAYYDGAYYNDPYYDTIEAEPVPSGSNSVSSLPAGCTAVNRDGVAYQQCGDKLYRPYYQGDQLVFVPE